MIECYIRYYNTKRVQRNLGVLTPIEKQSCALLHKSGQQHLAAGRENFIFFLCPLDWEQFS